MQSEEATAGVGDVHVRLMHLEASKPRQHASNGLTTR